MRPELSYGAHSGPKSCPNRIIFYVFIFPYIQVGRCFAFLRDLGGMYPSIFGMYPSIWACIHLPVTSHTHPEEEELEPDLTVTCTIIVSEEGATVYCFVCDMSAVK